MDILYYSNYCKQSQEVLQFFVRNNLAEKFNFINVDKRRVDRKTGQVYVQLENGKEIMLPPNVHSVPALLIPNENYRVVYGRSIMAKYEQVVQDIKELSTRGNGEPIGYSLGTSSQQISSEKCSSFLASSDDLSAKGSGGMRSLYNYVSANDDASQYTIVTPPDTYRPNKLSTDVTIDKIESKRNQEVPNMAPPIFNGLK
jgi:hypothetical protein